MARRPATVRVPTPLVQGEDSYVELRRMTWGERKEARKRLAELKGAESDAFLSEFVLSLLSGWNWVDGDGNPLPMPETVEAFDALHDEEWSAIWDAALRALRGQLSISEADLKN
jgi:phosphoenolpyruvate carboxylase